jgi:hypothetical protein
MIPSVVALMASSNYDRQRRHGNVARRVPVGGATRRFSGRKNSKSYDRIVVDLMNLRGL